RRRSIPVRRRAADRDRDRQAADAADRDDLGPARSDLRAAGHEGVIRAHRGATLPMLLLVMLTAPRAVLAWGFVAHRIIVENACVALPPGMAAFYGANLQGLSDASIEPDTLLRDREGEKEKRRHFIDLDDLSTPPFRDLPRDEEEARRLYGDERIDA